MRTVGLLMMSACLFAVCSHMPLQQLDHADMLAAYLSMSASGMSSEKNIRFAAGVLLKYDLVVNPADAAAIMSVLNP